MDTEDGQFFIKRLAYFVRTHEKALANALQLQRRSPKYAQGTQASGSANASTSASSSTTSSLASALSLPYLHFTTPSVKPVKLTLTTHHLFYLLSRFEELGIAVGPMNVRLENIHTEVLPGNYVSFLGSAPKSRGRASDADSIHSVSSVRSVMTSMSTLWSRFQSSEASKIEKQKAVEEDDLKYLYSAFTKIPCLRLAPDHRSKLIAGYEEFPFDTAVPLFAFKNLSALETCDLDFRQLYGWDRLAEHLRSLTIKRGGIDDVADLTINIVLDDMDKRRRRSSKHPAPSSPSTPHPTSSLSIKFAELAAPSSAPGSPMAEMQRRSSVGSPQGVPMARGGSSEGKKPSRARDRSTSPTRPHSSRHGSSYVHPRSSTPKFRRSSGSSNSSIHSSTPKTSSANLLTLGTIQSNKWRFLKHLSLSDNGLTQISASGLAPLTATLHSLDLSNNLFNEIPDSLASLTNLRALNLSNCMITSLQSLSRHPIPAITTINLRYNRLSTLAGIERLPSLERVDLRDNRLTDPTELARLTRIPDMQQIYVVKNPFARTHVNYRITIFNLFRSSPGYTEDIVIDSTGPSYSERRQLVDRVPEPLGVPVMRSSDAAVTPVEPEPDLPSVARPEQSETVKMQRNDSLQPVVSSKSGATMSRKKGTRRRVVELAGDDSPSSIKTTVQVSSPTAKTTPQKVSTSTEPEPTVYHTAQTNLDQTRPPLPTPASPTPAPLDTGDDSKSESGEDSANDTLDLSLSSNAYKQKIEALKNDFGNGWLAALNENKWDKPADKRDRSFSPARTGKPSKTDARGVSVGGRTLGRAT